MSYSTVEVLKRVLIQTRQKLEINIPLDNEEARGKGVGEWKVIHYDYFGRCYSLTLSEVSTKSCFDLNFKMMLNNIYIECEKFDTDIYGS